MKIYVVYVSGDYSQAVYVAIDEQIAKEAVKDLQEHNIRYYIEKYDLANDCLIELDCG